MFTVCPKCALTLTVTAADLRIAQGFVRCGQCTNVFNALLALSDERLPSPPPLPQQETIEPEPLDEPPDEPPDERADDRSDDRDHDHEDSAVEESPLQEEAAEEELVVDELQDEEFTQESPTADDDNSIEQTSLEFNPAAADVGEIFVEPEAASAEDSTGTYESVVLRTPEGSPSDAPATPRSADDELNEQLESLAARIEAARQNQLAQTHTGIQPLIMPLDLEPPAPPQEPHPHLWRAAVAVLAVLLSAAVLNHYRDDLAVNPRLHRPLTSFYETFGIKLSPHWDLAAYEVHQLGASAATQNAGQLTVRASVRNNAPQPQPLPLLRVTLLDRFGNRLASRDVPASAYLGGAPAAAASLLPSGERVDAQMAFVDPGKNAVGFEIDACLPAPSTRVHCANEIAAK